MSQNLVEIVTQSNDLTRYLLERGGELTPELEAMLDSVNIALAEKIDAYHHVMERMELEQGYWKAKADAMNRIAQAHAKVREKLKESIKRAMYELGKDEVLGNDVRFRLSTTKPALELTSELDPAYLMTVTEQVPDKDRIRKDLEAGKAIKGAALVTGFSLRPYACKKELK